MSWFYLILAIIFETFGTTALKMSNGFSVLLPSIVTIITYILCFLFLSFALKTIGILLISAVGMIFFHESVSLIKIISILLIVLGTVGLKLAH